MQFILPKEIKNKVDYVHNDVIIRKGVELSSEGLIIFNEFRKQIKKALEERFEKD